MEAADLRALGYSLVPGSIDKRPLVPWGQWRDRPQTDAEFAALGHGSLWAIVTGQAHGLVVLDFDGAEGAAVLDRLGLSPNVRTGSGGHHLWVQAPPYPVKTCAGIVPGVDVRGEGGLVWVIGRSKKGAYELLDPRPHGWSLLTPYLPERADVVALSPDGLAPYVGDGPGEEHAIRILAARCRDIRDSAPGTSNAVFNQAVHQVAGLTAGEQLDGQYAVNALVDAGTARGVGDLYQVLDAAWAAGSAKPWSAAPEPGWKEAGRNRSVSGTVEATPSGPSWSHDRLPMPLDALPKQVRDLTIEAAKVTAAPAEFIAASAIPSLGLALGGYVRLDLREGWVLTPHCYMALVGPPSTSKTPALARALAPAEAAEDTAWRNAGDKGPANRYLVDDTTTEKLGELLNQNPRGLLVFTDELKGFFGGMGQYKSGDSSRDRQFYLSAWSAKSFSIDRIKRGSMRVIDPAVSVIGGIQPGVFSDLVIAGAEDGMMERFLFVYGDPVDKTWIEDDVPGGTLRAYADLWNDLRDWGADTRTVRLTSAARAEWKRWYDSFHAEALDDKFIPMSGKAGTHVAKLALLLACCDESDVTPEHIQRAVLLTEYFLSQHCHVLRVAGSSSVQEKKQVKDREVLAAWLTEYEAKHGRLPSKTEVLQYGPPGARRAKERDILLDELGVVL